MKGIEINMMNCLRSRILTHNEKLMFREVSKCNDITYLINRLDYIETAMIIYARFGLYKFKGIYPNLNFTFSEMKFYCELINERLNLLKLYHERDQKIFKNL